MNATGNSSETNFKRALENLRRSVQTPITEPRDLSGIIKDFEMSYELSWKVLKKTLLTAGHSTLGAKDVFSKAYQLGYLSEEAVWLKMIGDRNQTSHVYDESEAKKIVERITNEYLPALEYIQKLLSA